MTCYLFAWPGLDNFCRLFVRYMGPINTVLLFLLVLLIICMELRDWNRRRERRGRLWAAQRRRRR